MLNSKKLLVTIAVALSSMNRVWASVNDSLSAKAQVPFGYLKFNLNASGGLWFRATFLNQTWVRFNQSNPQTFVLGEPKAQTIDIGLRRTRTQVFGQISDRGFLYFQFGLNNFNYLSAPGGNRKFQAFFHDAVGEYQIFKGKDFLTAGAGLTIVNGLSRFSQPGVANIATLDVPVFAQATVDQTDEFSRKFSVYIRGQQGKLNYRLAYSDPFPIQTNGQAVPRPGPFANFSTQAHRKQLQGFIALNLVDQEDNTLPGYMAGTYLGHRAIWNIEAGIIQQSKATFSQTAGSPIQFHDMLLWSVATYLDIPLRNGKGDCLNAYLGYFSTNYGPNYLRFNGIMNPADSSASFAGKSTGGNAFPMFGTGNVVYGQCAYKFPEKTLGNYETFGFFGSFQRSDLERIEKVVWVYTTGLNWFLDGHKQKISLEYSSRPTYGSLSNLNQTGRASCITLQYQMFL